MVFMKLVLNMMILLTIIFIMGCTSETGVETSPVVNLVEPSSEAPIETTLLFEEANPINIEIKEIKEQLAAKKEEIASLKIQLSNQNVEIVDLQEQLEDEQKVIIEEEIIEIVDKTPVDIVDNNPPEIVYIKINGVTLTNGSSIKVNAGDSINIEVHAKDELSGVKSVAFSFGGTNSLLSSSGNDMYEKTLSEGKYGISEYMKRGEKKLKLWTWDNAGNWVNTNEFLVYIEII